MCAPVTGYVIPARVGVWGVWGGQLSGVGFAARVCRAAAAPSLAVAVGVFRGPSSGTGTTRMRSPDRDLPNVP